MLIYSDSLGTREEVKECLNDIPEVWTWRYDMPNSFYVISNYESDQIANAIHKKMGKGRFLVTEITSNKSGWLPPESWHLINKKEHKNNS